jgi:Pentapeptide repeats (8 copies)
MTAVCATTLALGVTARQSNDMNQPQFTSRLWYVRRAARVRGPFPPGQISREILLGRIRDGDELSQDREYWRPLAELPQLHPQVLRQTETPEGRQHQLLARLREDERMRDRRGAGFAPEGTNRRHADRRNVESFDVVAHRERAARWATETPTEERNLLLPVAVILTAVLMLAMYFFWYEPAPPGPSPNCQAAPKPGINWTGCALLGRDLRRAPLRAAQLSSSMLVNVNLRDANLASADLSYANLDAADARGASLQTASLKGATLRGTNLTNADLRDTDMTYADLQGANLSGVQLQGARLDRAIWTDGRVCATESVGECRAPQ